MKYTLLALTLLGSAALAQDEDVYKSLALGDRVQVTFRNGNTLTGNLADPTKDEIKASNAAGAPRGKGAPAGKAPAPKAAVKGPSKPDDAISLYYFRSDKDAVCKTQDAALAEWTKKNPAVKVEIQSSGSELWTKYGVTTVPTLVFEAKASRSTESLQGLQTAEALDSALMKVREKMAAAVPTIDYSRETHITIDLSWEYPGLNGTMTIPKDQIKVLRKLQNLDSNLLERVKQEKAKLKAELEAQDADRRAIADRRAASAAAEAETSEKDQATKTEAATEGDAAIRKLDDLKRGLELLQKFPPDQWGPEKLKELKDKAIRKQIPTAEELEFQEGYPYWKAALEEYKKAPKEPKPEEKKEGEKPTEEKKEQP
jgi:hypothetical protein